MRTAVFTYDFPHRKSQEFLLRVAAEPDELVLVIGAPYVTVNKKISRLRIKPYSQTALEPRSLCRMLHLPYFSLPHNSEHVARLLIDEGVDVVIIGGARILREPVIGAPRLGIVNFHPGLIPDVRGLDALKWSVYRGVPPGVTAHLIDERVDAGRIVFREEIPVYQDDGWLDLSLRLEDRQAELVPEVLSSLRRQPDLTLYPLVDSGVVNRAMSTEIEVDTQARFEAWKAMWSVGRRRG
jgi:methionyl-tRNA formyltransferase